MKTNKNYKRCNSKRNINITILLSTILITMMFCIYSLADNIKPNQITYSPYIIITGDTLWDISSKYKQHKDDPRDYIREIVEINQLSSLNIIPGQKILIPILNN